MSAATTVDPELLAVLRCPETLQPVRVAEEAFVQTFLRLAREGVLQNLQGCKVQPDFETLLVREDRRKAYLVREGIPLMLIDEAVAL